MFLLSLIDRLLVVVNTPPRGVVVATPSSGFVIETTFGLSCIQWVDDSADFPLSYEFFYIAVGSGYSVPLSSGPSLSNTLSAAFLPAGNLVVMALVTDSVGGVGEALTNVSVSNKQLANGTTLIEYLTEVFDKKIYIRRVWQTATRSRFFR